ncbi:hypothetical protein F2Q68_00031914 [Brassica cretica]|uniref:Uncharacterized protein n=1 Tax=Brassica cretica TaxID=69181 RepID=A0A8S9GFN2_BRACR|nr:hypothetical protein F2Q68_00031914 [Brassica cretica]
MLVLKLKQETFRLTGFPLALQLLAFRAIPMLQSKIPAPSNEQTIMDLTEPNLPNHPSIELDSVLLVEDNPTLLVTPLIPVVRGPQPGWGLWSNEKTYDNVIYMEQLIANNHRFSKTMWPGGDCSEPVFTFTPTPEEPVHKKHTVLRKRKESKLKPHKVAKEKALLVTPLIPVLRGPQPGWGLWSNEKTYDNLTYMEQLIANNHRFSKTMWPGGDCWEPVFTFTPTPEEPVHKKHTVLRKRKESKLKPHKVAKEKAVDTEQRRITRLQAASTPTPGPTN